MLLAAQPVEQRLTLPNGLEVVLIEDHALPLVRAHLSLELPGSGPRLAFLGALQPGAGGGRRGAQAMAGALEDLGADLRFSWHPGSMEWRLLVGSAETEGAFEILADSVFRPLYDAGRVERKRSALRRQSQEATGRELALDRFLGGLGHPAGGRLVPEGTLLKLGLGELQDYRRAITDPRKARLVIHGDLTLPVLTRVLQEQFGTWCPVVTPQPEPLPLPPPLSEVQGLEPLTYLGRRIRLETSADREAFRVLAGVLAGRGLPEGLELELVLGEHGDGVVLAHGGPGLRVALAKLADAGLAEGELEAVRQRLREERALLPLHPEALVEARIRGAFEPLDGYPPAGVQTRLRAWLDPAGMSALEIRGPVTPSH